MTSIGDGAFSGCEALQSITIPNGVTCIGQNTFIDCTQLTSVALPACTISIDEYAFAGCSSLTSINIPDDVTTIGPMAFFACSGLKSITLPDSATEIDVSAFRMCSNLTVRVHANSYAHRWCVEEKQAYEIIKASCNHVPQILPAVAPTCTSTGLTERRKMLCLRGNSASSGRSASARPRRSNRRSGSSYLYRSGAD